VNSPVHCTTALHAAAVYDSPDDLRQRVLPYLHAGLQRGEAVVCLISRQAAETLASGLGDDAEQVRWQVPGLGYRHLGQMFESTREFLAAQYTAGTPTRLLSENDVDGGPGWMAGYLRFEAMATEIYGRYGFPFACLYDRRRHPADVVDHAAQVHPLLLGRDGTSAASDAYVEPEVYLVAHSGPLTPVPPRVALDIDLAELGDLPVTRHRVSHAVETLGLPAELLGDAELAATEIVTNAVQHGDGRCRVRVWSDGGAVLVRVDNPGTGGSIATAGFRSPRRADRSGAGMWLARQLADVVHIGQGPVGIGVELRFPFGN
jgi:anti-sigma regulatory factor (Ser/Thr protein kinase)